MSFFSQACRVMATIIYTLNGASKIGSPTISITINNISRKHILLNVSIIIKVKFGV